MVKELALLANGDRLVIVLAMAHFHRFINGPAPIDTDERALQLLQMTLDQLARSISDGGHPGPNSNRGASADVPWAVAANGPRDDAS